MPSSPPSVSQPEPDATDTERAGEPVEAPHPAPAGAGGDGAAAAAAAGEMPVPQALLLPILPALLPAANPGVATPAPAAALLPGPVLPVPWPKPFSLLALPTGPDAKGPLPSSFLLPMPPLLRMLLPGAADSMLLLAAPGPPRFMGPAAAADPEPIATLLAMPCWPGCLLGVSASAASTGAAACWCSLSLLPLLLPRPACNSRLTLVSSGPGVMQD